MMTVRIGFVGLGVMGRPMAENLLNDGFTLAVHNRTRSRADALSKRGALVCDTPRQVAETSDVVITMLPDTPDVDAVYFGGEGILQATRPGHLFIDMSTVTPAFARRLAEAARNKDADALDAPVSGGDVGARSGTLSIMVGGSPASFDRALPIFRSLGKNIVHMGEAGAGQITKACNQVVVALTIEAVAEGLILAAQAGVDPGRVCQALSGGLADSRILALHGQRMLERRFEPGFRLRLHRKDLAIALDTARRVHLELSHTALAHQHMDQMVQAGQGDWDHSALIVRLGEGAPPRED